MTKSIIAALSLTLAAAVQAQNAQPTWDLNKDRIDPASIHGTVECVDGTVTLDGQNSFSIPAKALGEQKDYTIEFELKRAEGAKGTLTVFSNADKTAKAGIEFQYSPPAYNAANIYINGNRTIERGPFLGDKFDKVTLVAKDRKLTLFRNGLILDITSEVNPSARPLTFGAVQKTPTTPYQVRAIKIYNTAVFPSGFDPDVERMRNYSGDQYLMQRVEVKDPKLPRILIVGDSISMGYRPFITEHFKGRAYVDYWVGGKWFDWEIKNGDFPLLRGWSGVLSQGPYDVVSYNSMTLHMWPHNEVKRTVEERYPAQLEQVFDHLKATAPKTRFIWIRCTPMTTPVEGGPSVLRQGDDQWKNDRIIYLNHVTDQIMAKYGIPEVDLYGLCEKNLDKASKDGVHWNKEAYKLMADAIIPLIEERLPKK